MIPFEVAIDPAIGFPAWYTDATGAKYALCVGGPTAWRSCRPTSHCSRSRTGSSSFTAPRAAASASSSAVNVSESVPSPLPDVATGSLRVTKVIAGPAAGRQGRIAILVACGEGSVRLREVQPPGKRRMNAAEGVRGRGVSADR